MTVAQPLAGKTIVITRPKQQSAAICQRLLALGAQVIEFPLIAIEPPVNEDLYLTQIKRLADYDCVIFTSRNAVDRGLEPLEKLFAGESLKQLLGKAKIAAVGKQTAAAIEQKGITVSIVPNTTFNSEALLEHPALREIAAQRIAIIRGEGGRDLLRSTLAARGAVVEYVDVYRRVCPADDLLPLVKFQAHGGVSIIALTSVEGLINLFALGTGESWLGKATLLVGSQRIADTIKDKTNDICHTGRVIVADDPQDDQMVSCLLDWAASAA